MKNGLVAAGAPVKVMMEHKTVAAWGFMPRYFDHHVHRLPALPAFVRPGGHAQTPAILNHARALAQCNRLGLDSKKSPGFQRGRGMSWTE